MKLINWFKFNSYLLELKHKNLELSYAHEKVNMNVVALQIFSGSRRLDEGGDVNSDLFELFQQPNDKGLSP